MPDEKMEQTVNRREKNAKNMNMKHIILLLALLFAGQAWGQVDLPPARKIEKPYRKDYREAVKEYNQNEKRIAEQWDVFLGPGESIPTDVISSEEYRPQAGYSNWFVELVRPESVAADMLRGAERKGIVNIMDTGCSTDHPDLQKGLLPGDNYTADPCPDVHGHSTHVLGISYLILKPLIDAGWIDVKMSKFLGDKGQGSFGAITGGVNEETAYMVDNYLDYGKFAVANNSWGGGTGIYGPLATALQKGKDAGIAYFFAAGNSGGSVIFPGLLPQVNAVSSLDQNLTISSFSSRGPEVDFAAGGRNIYSTYPGGKYANLSGTSMASPAMAGLGALAMNQHKELTAETLPGYLANIAQDLGEPGKDDLYGWGMAFARKIIDTPPGGEPEPDPPTCTDGKKNGDETGIDCGGPDCPACEPVPEPEPEKPPYKKRKFDLALDGSWVLRWVTAGGAAEYWPPRPEEAELLDVTVSADGALHTYQVDCYDMDAYSMFQPQGMTNLSITSFVVEVNSTTTYEWEYDALLEAAGMFYKNRSIGTPATWDVYDAGRYALYFLDYYLANEFKGYKYQDIKPVSVEFDWEGIKVVVSKDLANYQGKAK